MNNLSITNPPTRTPRIKYTKEEDENFVNFLKNKNYKNLAQAFEVYSASPLNIGKRTTSALEQRYNSYIKKNYELFIMANSKGGVVNSKYIPRDTIPNFKPIEIIMKQLLDLPQAERQRILSFFQ